MLSLRMQNAYRAALSHHRAYYDDFHEYGDLRTAERILYFVPGINGAPGQFRFALPALVKRFGTKFYIRCLHLPEFSSQRPIWEKYTTPNLERRRQKLVADMNELTALGKTVHVIASSNGFYDVYDAFDDFQRPDFSLHWVACAPDRFLDSPWFAIFEKMSGFDHEGHRWAAVPNHNWLRWLNSEAATSFVWKHQGQTRRFHKGDLECRVPWLGIQWAFTSPQCFNAMLRRLVARRSQPLPVDSYVLVGTRDGYWYGQPHDAVEQVLRRYLGAPQVLRRPRSHLWVNTPEIIVEFMGLWDERTQGKRQTSTTRAQRAR